MLFERIGTHRRMKIHNNGHTALSRQTGFLLLNRITFSGKVLPRVPPSFVRLVGVNCHALCCHKNGTLNRAWQEAMLRITSAGLKKINGGNRVSYLKLKKKLTVKFQINTRPVAMNLAP